MKPFPLIAASPGCWRIGVVDTFTASDALTDSVGVEGSGGRCGTDAEALEAINETVVEAEGITALGRTTGVTGMGFESSDEIVAVERADD